ncbi:MAG: hypothetical protein P4L46_07510 [Fimbriimonas sp.]|nr:hypothetical protein [Fimbriimonas sp.]
MSNAIGLANDRPLRNVVLHCLREYSEEASIPELMALLDGEDRKLEQAACAGIVYAGGQPVIEVLGQIGSQSQL